MDDKKKILVVDDKETWLHTIKLILGLDYDLTLKANPSEATELLKSTDFSLVILDKQFPEELSGIEILTRMRVIQKNLRAIILTGYADVETAVESMKVGALDYISKGTPNLAAELKARVKEALERKLSSDNEVQNLEDTDSKAILSLIAKGESMEVEFKSSARWDIRQSRANRDLETVIVKTIAAFLNSECGGTLLIGVDDNGDIIGLQHDYQTLGKKKDRDGYENFLISVLLGSYGKDINPFIRITFHQINNQEICCITAKPSPKAVFVSDDKGGEHLYIRTGNSTRQLTTREAVEYCKIRWKP